MVRLFAIFLVPFSLSYYFVFVLNMSGPVCVRGLIYFKRIKLFNGLSANNLKFYSQDINHENFDRLKERSSIEEPMFSISYDPLEDPSQSTLERDLEDVLMERALRFFDEKFVKNNENCYLVGLEDKSLSYNNKRSNLLIL